jgi:uncharacterized protein with HEPN domain
MEDDDKRYLMHMNQGIGRIRRYTAGGQGEFMGSIFTQSAVLWELLLICDAARRMTEATKEMHPETNWDHMCRLFDHLVEHPAEIEPTEIWHCVEEQLPKLGDHIREMILATHMK